MIQLAILSALVALVLVGWFTARGKARLFARDGVTTWSRPEYHAAHLVLWILVPALVGWLAWSALVPSLALPQGVRCCRSGAAGGLRAKRRKSESNPGRLSFPPAQRKPWSTPSTER